MSIDNAYSHARPPIVDMRDVPTNPLSHDLVMSGDELHVFSPII